MKLPSWISIIALAEANQQACTGTNQIECDGAACEWNGSACTLTTSNDTSNFAEFAKLILTQSLLGTSSSEMQAGDMNGLNMAGLALMGKTDLLAGLPLNDFLPYSNNNYLNQAMAPGGFYGNKLTNQYFSCPIDVPFCRREACTDYSDSEANAYSCYSQPGCCFDQNLYVHKKLFGSSFYKSVPVCYKAIQNPLFSQLAEEVTAQGNQFNPQYIQPMVNKVLDFMDSPLTKQAMRNYMQCPPEDGTYQSYEFLSKLQTRFPAQATTISWMMTRDDYFDDLMTVLTSEYGWLGIQERECVMTGGCWNTVRSKCQASFDVNDITEEQITSAMNHINFLQFMDKTKATPEAKSLNLQTMSAVQALNAGTQNSPWNAALFAGQNMENILKYQFLTKPNNGQFAGLSTYAALTGNPIDFTNANYENLAQLSNLMSLTDSSQSASLKERLLEQFAASTLGLDTNTLWMIRNFENGQAINADLNVGLGLPAKADFGTDKLTDYFKYQAMMQGKIEFGSLFGNDAVSTCPAAEVSVNCMEPSSTQFTDFLGMHQEKSLCKAKGCCWDQSRQNNNSMGLTRFMCPWNPEFSIYTKFSFLPSIQTSLRGCCALSACVQHDARPVMSNPDAVVGPRPSFNSPVAMSQLMSGNTIDAMTLNDKPTGGVINAQFTEWVTSSCTVECGGGTQTKHRDCISGCDNLRYKRQFKRNIPCNKHACEWNMTTGGGFGKK